MICDNCRSSDVLGDPEINKLWKRDEDAPEIGSAAWEAEVARRASDHGGAGNERGLVKCSSCLKQHACSLVRPGAQGRPFTRVCRGR